MIRPTFLRCEYLINPLGIDRVEPRLSWILESDQQAQKQTAYRILVARSRNLLGQDKGDLWDSRKVISEETCHIGYDGKKLKSREECHWKVMIWDRDGNPSNWSEEAFWSMGLLNSSDWKAKWIGEERKKRPWLLARRLKKKQMPCPLLRKSFEITKKVDRAYVYVTALGEYELRINGMRVGNHMLAPEWTDYAKRVQYQTYDVSELLRSGENVLAAILADGWYAGYLGPGSIYYHSHYGVNRLLLLQMDVKYADGTSNQILSDASWRMFKDGPIRQSDHFWGEIYDTRKEQDGWDNPGFDDFEWSFVSVDNRISSQLVAQMNEPIRIVKKLKPVAITEPIPNVFIFDLGQNIQGWCKIRLSRLICNPNMELTLRHGELLNLDGTLYTKNLRTVRAIDKYVLDNYEEREFEPHFTYHGFQYVEISGLKGGIKPDLEMLMGCVISSDTSIVGEFQSSLPKLNKLWYNIMWTQRDNLIGIPTDCPQRDERLGWLGDVQTFAQTSIYNMDMAAFYSKWIQDIRDTQTEEGIYPKFSPYPYKRNHKPPFNKKCAAPAWADCGVTLPWDLYLNYGDVQILRQHYESAKNFINYVYKKSPNLIWKHAPFSHIGDWLNGDKIEAEGYPKKGAAIPKKVFATAFFAHSTEILSKMAEVLGKSEDSNYYRELAEQIKTKFHEMFVDKNGVIKGDTQAGYSIALNFNLLPENLRKTAFDHLLKAIEKYDHRISTGFCTTTRMMLELVRCGYPEVAYDLILSERFPSWFYMINQGATTMWERWDGYVKGRGFQTPSMNSFNHYALGAIGEFFYKVILGINLDENEPGYKHIIIKPKPNSQLTWVKGSYDSIRGKVGVEWYLNENDFILNVSIPPNTHATVYLPALDLENIFESDTPLTESKDLSIIGFENHIVALKTCSGKFQFNSKLIFPMNFKLEF